MANILSIGQTALNAAQIGLATTGHNIANAATPGYSRQLVVQTTPNAQGMGRAFVGSGTEIATVKRAYDQYLNNQVNSSHTAQGELSGYYSQIQQINNLFADPTSGLSPSLQSFFAGLQNVAANPTSGPSRQSMLASANTLASQFQSLDGQINEIRQGLNGQITTSIETINTYSTQIAALNDAISKAQLGDDAKPANDLLDQRDQVISDLSKQIQVSVVKQENNYNIFIGNGQPLVVSNQGFSLAPIASTTDLSRIGVGYKLSNGAVTALADTAVTGGVLGGLFQFRSQTLDSAQNALGRVAIGLATTFNAQHVLGQDQNGDLGGAFFNVGSPLVTPSTTNTSTAMLTSNITNVSALTTSDYRIQYDGTNYTVTQLSDNTQLSSTTLAAAQAAVAAKGFDFNVVGTPAAGDRFLVRPTVNGASGISVAISDTAKIAVGAPIRTATVATNAGSGQISAGVFNEPIRASTVVTNTGTGQISAGTTDYSYTAATVTPPVTLTYNTGAPDNLTGFPALLPVSVMSGGTTTVFAAGAPVTYTAGATISFGGVSFTLSGAPNNTDTFTIGANTVGPSTATPSSTLTYNAGAPNNLTGFPPLLPVSVTNNGTTTVFAAGAPVDYTDGATISYGNISFTVSGTPAAGDTFTVGPNINGAGDNRNALLLGALQTANTLVNGTSSYQGAYGMLVNAVGNKTRELEVTTSAATQLLTNAIAAQQSVSGVNLDEEATNLLRYQQAYQAAGKVMQTATKMFDVLLSLGN